jgi:hypothetical protein
VQENARIAIDVRDFRVAGGSGDESGIVGEVTLGRELAHIDDVWTYGAGVNREIDRLVVDGQLGSLARGICHVSSRKDEIALPDGLLMIV